MIPKCMYSLKLSNNGFLTRDIIDNHGSMLQLIKNVF